MEERRVSCSQKEEMMRKREDRDSAQNFIVGDKRLISGSNAVKISIIIKV